MSQTVPLAPHPLLALAGGRDNKIPGTVSRPSRRPVSAVNEAKAPCAQARCFALKPPAVVPKVPRAKAGAGAAPTPVPGGKLGKRATQVAYNQKGEPFAL